MNYTEEEMRAWSHRVRAAIMEQMNPHLKTAADTGAPENVARVSSACITALIGSIIEVLASTIPTEMLVMATSTISAGLLELASAVQKDEQENK